jgi:hypothetical protein
MDIDRTQIIDKPSRPSTNVIKQFDELYTNDRLPESIIFLYTGLNQSNVNEKNFFLIEINFYSFFFYI